MVAALADQFVRSELANCEVELSIPDLAAPALSDSDGSALKVCN